MYISRKKKTSLLLFLTPSDPKETFQMRGLNPSSQDNDTKVFLFSSKTVTDLSLNKTWKMHCFAGPKAVAEWGVGSQANNQGWRCLGRVCCLPKRQLESFTQVSWRSPLKGRPEQLEHVTESLLGSQTTHKQLKTTSPDCVKSSDGFLHVHFLATMKNVTKKAEKAVLFSTEKWAAASAFCPHDLAANLQGHMHRLAFQRTSRDLVFLTHSIFSSTVFYYNEC